MDGESWKTLHTNAFNHFWINCIPVYCNLINQEKWLRSMLLNFNIIFRRRVFMTKVQKQNFINRPYPTREDFLADLVGQFVKRRKSLGLTQANVNRKMGNTDRLVSKWECGMLTPTSFNLYCWAQALGCSLEINSE